VIHISITAEAVVPLWDKKRQNSDKWQWLNTIYT